MNEQLKQLWNEAAKRNAKLVAGPNSWETEVNFMNTFAELIIRKCASVADIADENKCEWIGGNILTYFGVQE